MTALASSFVSVAVCDGLTVFGVTPANASDVGLNNSDPTTAVPLSDTDWLPPGASSVKVITSLFAPAEYGRKASEIVHDEPAGT